MQLIGRIQELSFIMLVKKELGIKGYMFMYHMSNACFIALHLLLFPLNVKIKVHPVDCN